MTPADLRAIRLRLGLTQEAFGATIGYSRRMVQSMELGAREINPRVEIILAAEISKLAKAPRIEK